MTAPFASLAPRGSAARWLWLFASALPWFSPLGCGDEFSSGEPTPSGSGGAEAGEGGEEAASVGGGAGTTADAGNAPGGEGHGGGSGGDRAAGGGGSGGAGDGEGGQGGHSEECRVECCNGSLLVEDHPDAAACFSLGAEGCGTEGPLRAEFAGETWRPAASTCPTTRPCNLTCCNGEEHEQTAFDEALCVASAREDAFCRERGGPQRVEFDGSVVWEDHECALGDYNCLATCCDGSRSYITQEAENECAFYGMYACEHDGGPIDIAFDGVSVFTADVECPTARTCMLECCDGFEYDRSPAFGTNNCVFFNATSTLCADEGHLANARVIFGGEVAWDGTCP